MEKSMLGEISRLRSMTVGDLQCEWLRLYGEPTRSRNRSYLWHRLAYRVQELAHGGLSDQAKMKIEELAPSGFQRVRMPGTDRPRERECVRLRDLRLPTPGTVLTRSYHGREVRVVTLEDGFEWDGKQYRSLSAVARAVTGARWNGKLFFGLVERKRRS